MSKLLNLPGELLLWYVRAAAVGEGGLNRPVTGDDSYLCLISTSPLFMSLGASTDSIKQQNEA